MLKVSITSNVLQSNISSECLSLISQYIIDIGVYYKALVVT